MNKVKIEKIMFTLFDKYEEYDDIKDKLRNLHTFGEVTDEEYDYCIRHWDEILLDWESQVIFMKKKGDK